MAWKTENVSSFHFIADFFSSSSSCDALQCVRERVACPGSCEEKKLQTEASTSGGKINEMKMFSISIWEKFFFVPSPFVSIPIIILQLYMMLCVSISTHSPPWLPCVNSRILFRIYVPILSVPCTRTVWRVANEKLLGFCPWKYFTNSGLRSERDGKRDNGT